MYNRIYDHVTTNSPEKQFGFKKQCSTEYAILQLSIEILKSFEQNKYTLVVFIDLNKVFDTVNNDILLTKLKYFGIKNTYSTGSNVIWKMGNNLLVMIIIDPDFSMKTLNGSELKCVQDYKYLCSFISSSEKDFKTRKGMAWTACNNLHNVWTSSLDDKIKINTFKTMIEPILLYGSETWTLQYSNSDLMAHTPDC